MIKTLTNIYSPAEKFSFSLILQVTKFRITILVAFTTALGYILASNNIDLKMLFTSAGIFLLACGASAINHIQEKETDAIMHRTQHRPIPAGKLTVFQVKIISAVTIFTGCIIMVFGSTVPALIIGIFNLLFYNIIYLRLKRKTTLAVIPGALVGALPPIAGWIAAGGNIFDIKLLTLAAFFFVWQIPHFWLLILIFGDDYKKAGLPVLSEIFNENIIQKITYSWILLTILISFTLFLSGLIYYNISVLFFYFINFLLLIISTKLFMKNTDNVKIYYNQFITLNTYTLLIILLLFADRTIKIV